QADVGADGPARVGGELMDDPDHADPPIAADELLVGAGIVDATHVQRGQAGQELQLVADLMASPSQGRLALGLRRAGVGLDEILEPLCFAIAHESRSCWISPPASRASARRSIA